MISKSNRIDFITECYEKGTLKDSVEVRKIENELINQEVREAKKREKALNQIKVLSENEMVYGKYKTVKGLMKRVNKDFDKKIDEHYNSLENREHIIKYKEEK